MVTVYDVRHLMLALLVSARASACPYRFSLPPRERCGSGTYCCAHNNSGKTVPESTWGGNTSQCVTPSSKTCVRSRARVSHR